MRFEAEQNQTGIKHDVVLRYTSFSYNLYTKC